MASAFLCRTVSSSCGARLLRGQEHTSCSHKAPRLFTAGHRKQVIELQPRLGRNVVVRSYQDEYDKLFNSPIFRSDLVKEEFTNIAKQSGSLSQLAAKFPDFDLSGKRMYLDKMEELSERYEIFIKRLELSGDPAAKEFLRFNNSQMLEGGMTYQQLFAGLKMSLENYRSWVAEEERLSSNPVEHQKFLQWLRGNWQASLLGKMDMSFMFEKVDPQIISKAYNDPQFWVALREISENPTSSVMAKWLDVPNIGPFVAEMWKSMQQRNAT